MKGSWEFEQSHRQWLQLSGGFLLKLTESPKRIRENSTAFDLYGIWTLFLENKTH